MKTIKTALQYARENLNAFSETPMLDAEILLSTILQISRIHLFTFPEKKLTEDQVFSFENFIEQRKQKMPIAYMIGQKEFWSLNLKVTRDTLIPRPETELLVEKVLQEIEGPQKIVADLGTGTGAIALALAFERPIWEIHATDMSQAALEVAKCNAMQLSLPQIIFHQGDWLAALPFDKQFDCLVSNPPYIDPEDPCLKQTSLSYEPVLALSSDESGLKAIRHIITQSKKHLKKNGFLIIEHGFEQGNAVRSIFANLDYSNIITYPDLAGLERITGGRA